MTSNRKILIGMFAIAAVFGVSALAAATGDLSIGGSAAASGSGSVDASPQVDQLHQTVTDATHKADGALNAGADASGSATGTVDAQAQHLGVSAGGDVSGKVSGDSHGIMDQVRGWIDQLFGHVDGKANVDAGAAAEGKIDASGDGHANAQGSFMSKLAAGFAGLFHL